MSARRLSDIVIALMRSKARGGKLIGKTPLERELQAWIDGPSITCPVYPIAEQPAPPINDSFTLEQLQAICFKQGGIIRRLPLLSSGCPPL